MLGLVGLGLQSLEQQPLQASAAAANCAALTMIQGHRNDYLLVLCSVLDFVISHDEIWQ